MKKFGKVMIAAVVCTLWGSITAFAGEWKSDANGQWYVKDDGNYVVSDWLADNGKMYYFNEDGYMVSNAWVGNYYVGNDGAMLTNTTTPDGYYVGADGVWVEGGHPEVQNNQYLDAYAAFLRSYKISKGLKPKFHLLYIDSDEIPELVIADSNIHIAIADLYNYDHGMVQHLGSFGGSGCFTYVQGANLFCSPYEGNGGWTNTGYYTLQNNNCIHLIEFKAHEWMEQNDYWIDDIAVTKDVYNSKKAAWDTVYTPVSQAGYAYGYELNETNIKKMLEDIQNVMPNYTSIVEPDSSEN